MSILHLITYKKLYHNFGFFGIDFCKFVLIFSYVLKKSLYNEKIKTNLQKSILNNLQYYFLQVIKCNIFIQKLISNIKKLT